MKTITKAAALSLSLLLIFTGCGGEQSEPPAAGVTGDREMSADTDIMETDTSVPDMETGETKAYAPDIPEADTDTATVAGEAPDDEFSGLGEKGEFGYGYTGGRLVPIALEEYYDLSYARSMLTRESYEAYREANDEDISYEDYEERMFSWFSIDRETAERAADYDLLILLSYSGYGKNEDVPSEEENDGETGRTAEGSDHPAAARAGFEKFRELLSSGELDLPEYADMLDVRLICEEDRISLTVLYYDNMGERQKAADKVPVCIPGERYYLVGTKAVPRDTRSLFITCDGENYAHIRGYDPELYDSAVFFYSDREDVLSDTLAAVDLSDICENLPELSRLYISGDIPVTGLSSLGDLKHLELSAAHMRGQENNRAFSGLSGLTVYDVKSREDILWLEDCGAQEIALSCSCDGELLAYVFSLPGVTELSINEGFNDSSLDLVDIGEMKSLKRLRIVTDTNISEFSGTDIVPDLAPLIKLTGLEELSFTGNNAYNLDVIGNIKGLKRLSLQGLGDDETGEGKTDLSLFKNCTGIEYLELQNVHSSIYGAFPFMENLKTLRLGSASAYSDGLHEITQISGLEELIIDGEDVSLSGIGSIKSLKTLQIINSGYDSLGELKDCPEFTRLVMKDSEGSVLDIDNICETTVEEIYLDNVGLRHYDGLKSMTGLKKLTVISGNLTEEQLDELTAAMPGCEINWEDPFLWALPLTQEFVGDIRIETYPNDDDRYQVFYIKNCGDEPMDSLPRFVEENLLSEDYDMLAIGYPSHGQHDSISENYTVTDGSIDYESFERYLSVLDSAPNDEYIREKEYRRLAPGDEAYIRLVDSSKLQ